MTEPRQTNLATPKGEWELGEVPIPISPRNLARFGEVARFDGISLFISHCGIQTSPAGSSPSCPLLRAERA